MNDAPFDRFSGVIDEVAAGRLGLCRADDVRG